MAVCWLVGWLDDCLVGGLIGMYHNSPKRRGSLNFVLLSEHYFITILTFGIVVPPVLRTTQLIDLLIKYRVLEKDRYPSIRMSKKISFGEGFFGEGSFLLKPKKYKRIFVLNFAMADNSF